MVEDVDFVLELGALGAELVRGRLAVVLDFGAEFGTGGAEEVGFLFFWRAVSDCGRSGRRLGEGMGRTFSTSDLLTRPSFATSRFSARRLRTAFMSVTLWSCVKPPFSRSLTSVYVSK